MFYVNYIVFEKSLHCILGSILSFKKFLLMYSWLLFLMRSQVYIIVPLLHVALFWLLSSFYFGIQQFIMLRCGFLCIYPFWFLWVFYFILIYSRTPVTLFFLSSWTLTLFISLQFFSLCYSDWSVIHELISKFTVSVFPLPPTCY